MGQSTKVKIVTRYKYASIETKTANRYHIKGIVTWSRPDSHKLLLACTDGANPLLWTFHAFFSFLQRSLQCLRLVIAESSVKKARAANIS